MSKNSEKNGPPKLDKAWFLHGYASILSIVPQWKKRENPGSMLFNKLDFVDLKDPDDKILLLEQYRILSEQVNKITENRESLNNFWVTLNGAIVGTISYIKDMQLDTPNPKNLFIGTLIFFGFILSALWSQALGKIEKDIEIKNEMIMEMEKFLPAKIFTTSFQIKEKMQERSSLSLTEKNISFLFCIGYTIVAAVLLIYPNII